MRKTALALLLIALATLVCHQALFVAPPGSTIRLIANPPFIAAHGGVSIITAIVTEPAGTPVADGTVVQFFTDLGRIDEQGRTNDGVARVNFVSDSRSGTATIRAVSGAPAPAAPGGTVAPSPGTTLPPATGGGGTDTVQVVIGTALPSRVEMTAFPPRITDSRSTHVFARAYDANGNPVANVPIVFEVLEGTVPAPPAPGTPASSEHMDSQGRPIFTDNNGQAEDVMRTTRQPGTTPTKTVTVRATTPRGVTGSILILIN